MIPQPHNIAINDIVFIPAIQKTARVELVDGDIVIVSIPLPQGHNNDELRCELMALRPWQLTLLFKADDESDRAPRRRMSKAYAKNKNAIRMRLYYEANKEKVRAYYRELQRRKAAERIKAELMPN